MAIVKVTRYTKSQASAKAIISYIQGRPGKDRESILRELFGHDGVMDKNEALRMVEEAEDGTIFYPLVISPDPNQEDTGKDLHLWEITQKTMLHLEDRLKAQVRFVAAEHSDHSPNRHVHVLALLSRKLDKKDLAYLRQIATQEALFQRRERDLAREQAQAAQIVGRIIHSPKRQSRKGVKRGATYTLGSRGERPTLTLRSRRALTFQTCPRCGVQLGAYRGICGNCGQKLRFEWGRRVAWER